MGVGGGFDPSGMMGDHAGVGNFGGQGMAGQDRRRVRPRTDATPTGLATSAAADHQPRRRRRGTAAGATTGAVIGLGDDLDDRTVHHLGFPTGGFGGQGGGDSASIPPAEISAAGAAISAAGAVGGQDSRQGLRRPGMMGFDQADGFGGTSSTADTQLKTDMTSSRPTRRPSTTSRSSPR